MMDIPNPNYLCPLCGWPKLTEDPERHTHEICPCCGMQIGTALGQTWETLRQEWIAAGMPWWSRNRPAPADWNPVEQLKHATGTDRVR